MAAVITVAQQKGGAGKTTLAASLAAALAARHRVALLDSDPQRSLMRWHALRGAAHGAIEAAESSGWRLDTAAGRLRQSGAVVLIDSPPQVDHDARRAVRAADLVLVPVQPSPPDLWAARATLALAAAERRTARLVLNRVAGGERAQAAARALVRAELGAEAEASLVAVLGNRAGYAHAFARGLGVTEAAPRTTAAAEVGDLARRVEELLGLTA